MTGRAWLQIGLVAALVISVIANAFLIGFVVRQARSGPGGGGAIAQALVSAYPKEVRVEFRRLLREKRPDAVTALRELRQARRALADAASATPYVEVDVKNAMQRVRAATDVLQEMMQSLLLEALQNTRQAA